METSLFIQYVKKLFAGVVLGVVNKLNDTKNPVVYYHKRFLKKEYSVDGTWESISANNTLVMADVVSMDSSLPLKKRDAVSRANGDIPKMGMKLKLNEKQLTDLQSLKRKPGAEPQLVAKLFQDTPKVIGGIYERNEAMLLEAMSTGMTVVEDTENVGSGVRVDFMFPHKFGVATLWSDVNSKPLTDLSNIKEAARLDGNAIIKYFMDRSAFNNLTNTTQVKEQYAFAVGFVGSNIQSPDLDQFNRFSQNKYGFTIEIIERSVRYEKNGVQTPQTPWATGAVLGVTTEQLGSLVWADLAEDEDRVAGVEYEKADDYILVSKYKKNDPLTEWTSSQARVVPVLSNVDQLYLIDSTVVQA